MGSTQRYRIDGIKLANGKQAYGSREMSVWLPVYARYMKEIHKINLVFIKIEDLSATAASASTHVGGYASDQRTWNLTTTQKRKDIYESTRLGRPGHIRVPSQGFQEHTHSMLDVGYITLCSYQIVDTKRGLNGLARRGADRDKAFRPSQPWPTWNVGLAMMLEELNPPKPVVVNVIPRTYTRKPWMYIPVNGLLSGLTLSRIQWQLSVFPTGKLDHYTIRALKVWLGGIGEDDGKGILYRKNIMQLQGRVGAKKDADWGPETTKAFQTYLNNNR